MTEVTTVEVVYRLPLSLSDGDVIVVNNLAYRVDKVTNEGNACTIWTNNGPIYRPFNEPVSLIYKN